MPCVIAQASMQQVESTFSSHRHVLGRCEVIRSGKFLAATTVVTPRSERHTIGLGLVQCLVQHREQAYKESRPLSLPVGTPLSVEVSSGSASFFAYSVTTCETSERPMLNHKRALSGKRCCEKMRGSLALLMASSVCSLGERFTSRPPTSHPCRKRENVKGIGLWTLTPN